MSIKPIRASLYTHPTVAATRKRNTTRQREAGAASRAETRRRLIKAAGEEFNEVGYVAATVSRIAKRAGVSVQTLYLACGSKRELLGAHLLDTLSAGARPADHFPAQITVGDSAGVIDQFAQIFQQVADRSGGAWALYRDAAAVDPAIAADWQELQTLRRGTIEAVLAPIPDHDLRLARADAVDTAWAIASPDAYDLFVRRAGYSLDRFEQWVATTLRAALLRPTVGR
jgi:AcrR family transcriptional regulator